MKYLLLILLVSCIANDPNKMKQKTPVSKSTIDLHKRGFSQESREDYIKFIGYDFYSTTVRESFREGKISNGMSKIMVEMIYGPPNKVKDSKWIYTVEGQSLSLIIEFKRDTVSAMSFSFK